MLPTMRPVSSRTSRAAVVAKDSPYSRWPPGHCKVPVGFCWLGKKERRGGVFLDLEIASNGWRETGEDYVPAP